MSVYTCGLCGTAHDSVQAALRCCEERFEGDGDDDPDHWTCADCGRFATPTFRDDDGDRCVWCGADRRDDERAARDRPAPGVDVDPIATAPEEAVADENLRTDGGTHDIGDVHAASVLEHDGQAVLAIEGTDGAVRITVPESMVEPLQDTAHELGFVYDAGEHDEALIGDGAGVEPSEWPYAAVVHGADLRRDCLALTGSGSPCTNQAYDGEQLCGIHQDAADPEVAAGAHQWARIGGPGDDATVAVCVRCRDVWHGGTAPTAVECPACGVAPGSRCTKERSGAGVAAPIPSHPARRRRAREVLDAFDACPEAPVELDDEQATLAADGGTRSVASSEPRTPYEPARAWSSVDELDGIDLREGEGCPHCGGRRDGLVQNPAGWFSCYTCGARWAGDLDDASLHDEPYRGPAVAGESGPEEGSR